MSTKELAKYTSEHHVMNHKKAFLLSFLASFGFAISNYLVADLSVKVGFKWFYPIFIQTTIFWIIYHVAKILSQNKERVTNGLSAASIFDRNTSAYINKSPVIKNVEI